MSPASSDRVFAERYRVLRRLGAGGMATVYLAEDERLGRKVAVKRLHAESPDDVIARFSREARLGASLNHANIVQIYDTVPDEESVLIVMEYVEGGTLRDALRDGPLEPARALELLYGVAAALDAAHSHGVIHRDVKPANILVTPRGDAKLADLGIATAAEHTKITRSGTVLGTAAYMAPERLNGEAGGPAVDVYALAAVAFETLSGRKAISGKTAMEVAQRVVAQPPPDLGEFVPGTPDAAAAAICRGLSKAPDARPATAGELVRELTEAYAGAVEREPAPEPAPEPTQTFVPVAAPVPVEPPPAPDPEPPPRAPEPEPEPEPEPVRAAAPSRPRPQRRLEPPPSAAPPARRSGRPARSRRAWILPVAIVAIGALILAAALGIPGSGGDDDPGRTEVGGAEDSGQQQTTPSGAGSDPGAADAPSGGAAGGDGAASVPASGPAATPEAAVQAFYTRAAADDFDEAWELASPRLRNQLQGYNSFKGTFSTLQSIEFSKVKTSGNTVSFRSVATHTGFVDRCRGSGDTVESGGNVLLDHISVSCQRG